MNDLHNAFPPFSRMKKLLWLVLTLIYLILSISLFSACKKELALMDYVSELRSNIFLADTNELSLRIYSVTKETPYVADGVPCEKSTRLEARLSAPSGDKDCYLSFSVNGKTYGGEMSFDNVKTEYYYSCTLDVSALNAIDCVVEYGESRVEMQALSVINKDTLSPNDVLNKLKNAEVELFSSMTDKYGFAGEIYLRLIYEDFPYYYVGVIDRNGNVTAFLINAQTGKILAKRTT